jgi:hypothetical protein
VKLSIRHVAAAVAVALLSLSTRAADPPPADDRSTPGTVVPSTGTTASQPAASPPTMAAPPVPVPPIPDAATPPPPTAAPASRPLPARAARVAPARAVKPAGSLSGPSTTDCAALRRRYAQSQACFEPYRLANGGIRPEAFNRCREVPDPATQCGPETEAPGQ